MVDARVPGQARPAPRRLGRVEKLAAYIKARLPRGRYETLPGGLRNVVGEIPGKGKPILLAAHYDTKDIPGFVGANDGAGGTAALLEIARALQRSSARQNASPIRFIAFDGEEATDDADFYGTGLRGSKPYAKKHATSCGRWSCSTSSPTRTSRSRARRARTRRCGPTCVTRPSARRRRLRVPGSGAGRRRGRPHAVRPPGVPSIDLIDFSFPCWHKTCDDLTAVSKASLDKSGEAVLEFLRNR